MHEAAPVPGSWWMMSRRATATPEACRVMGPCSNLPVDLAAAISASMVAEKYLKMISWSSMPIASTRFKKVGTDFTTLGLGHTP